MNCLVSWTSILQAWWGQLEHKPFLNIYNQAKIKKRLFDLQIQQIIIIIVIITLFQPFC